MDNDAAVLRRLEQLMTEFFSPQTSNDQKRSIEQSLHEFAAQIDSWRLCLYFLSSTDNRYVSMFALTTLEQTAIGRRWPVLGWEDRAIVRSTLYTLSLERGITPFVRNKVVKLVVDIARHDWPHFYSDFFSNILQLLGHRHTRLLGLVYLKTASEELGTPREDLPLHRKAELLRLFNSLVPTALDVLTELLVETTKHQNRSGTITPPPSPTGAQSAPLQGRTVLDVEGLAAGSGEICIITLEVLAHLFTWITLTDHFSTNLLNVIFTCAKYRDSMNGRQIETAVQALTTINELLYRPSSPSATESLLLQIFQRGIELFQSIEHLESIDESYLEKMTEYLQLFVTNHLKKVESCPKFPVNALLEVLYHHTFQRCITPMGYTRSLEVWSILLESTQARYATVALALAERVLQKVTFKFNAHTLKVLDTDTLDENDETEWQHFLRCNIECLAKVADISPIPVFTLLYQSWRESLSVYAKLGSAVASGQVVVLNDSEASNVRIHLRDLASMTQALARLYVHFVDKRFGKIGDQPGIDCSLAEELVSQTFEVCTFAKDNQLHRANLQPVEILQDLVEVNSQMLASLQAWCHWISERPEKLKDSLSQRCVQSCIWALMPNTFPQNLPPKFVHSAAHLMQSTVSILKPNLWDQPAFNDLVVAGSHPHLNQDTAKVLRRALVNGIILPAGDIGARQRLMGTMVTALSHPLGGEGQPVPPEIVVSSSVLSLKELLEDCRSSSTAIKKLLHTNLESTVNRVLELLPHLIRFSGTCETLLSFLHSAFAVLQQQLGPEYTQNAAQAMLHIFTRENISIGPTLDQLLEILILVVSAPGRAFKAFVPSITDLCLSNVWPVVRSDLSDHPDTTIVLLRLLHSILMHHWQYFYNSSVLRTFGNPDEAEPVEHREELVAILEAFGQALLQPDVNIFRQSLQSLEQLNSRCRLYQRSIFKTNLLERFLAALLTVLFQRSHDLLADEIATAVHSLALVNCDWFFGEFLPKFLTGCEGLDDEQRCTLLENFDRATDQPTLTRSVLRMVTDLRCYQFCRTV
ncbi:exportin-6-A isoform X1 [Neodiprion virginianus]|uniref:exportin-6-A isoform X1 n=1 Tax=Neodiprion virginianus TaxID=2961670 RepID=UPI001EE7006B|nr:exportin-6-A isoform X1 [Neodiprion virginianus]